MAHKRWRLDERGDRLSSSDPATRNCDMAAMARMIKTSEFWILGAETGKVS
jgi:hypothetical protein